MDIFEILPAQVGPLPILISIPHGGTFIPTNIQARLKPQLLPPDDTDWFVKRLYSFAPAMGIMVIAANYSRWVVDLNRDPQSKPLYNDGRIITALCPSTDFLGHSIYEDGSLQVPQTEVDYRMHSYFEPYHQKLQSLLDDLKARFGKVLLWDAHSIRQRVITIYKEPFPDLILGDADGTAADKALTGSALSNLVEDGLSLEHNHPFKGGFITRHFGKPVMHQHALQLEMTKVNYMDDSETMYDEARASRMQAILKRTLESLASELQNT